LSPTDHTDIGEEQLILSAQIDPARFEPLYQKYFRRTYSFVLHRVGDKETAADVTSKVFLQALINLKKFKFQGLPLSSWLFRIAINECNGYFRKRKAQRHVILDDHTLSSLFEVFEEHDTELEKKLRDCIQKLDREDVELLQLRFFESYRFKEIAEILDITENNAKVKIYRLIDKLRKLMQS